MNNVIEQMLSKYEIKNTIDEIIYGWSWQQY